MHRSPLNVTVRFFPGMVMVTPVTDLAAWGCDLTSPVPVNWLQGTADSMVNEPSRITMGVSSLAHPFTTAATGAIRILCGSIRTAGSRVPELSILHMKHADAADLERKIGYTFKKRELLEQALTHSSHASEHGSSRGRGNPPPGMPLTAPGTAPAAPIAAPDLATQDLAAQDNEQLEFLGDAVLGFVTSDELFQRFPDYTEGELSKLRAQLVSARHLVHAARKLQLGEYLRLGRGEERAAGVARLPCWWTLWKPLSPPCFWMRGWK